MEDNEQLTRVISDAVANAIRQASNESSGNSSEQLNQVFIPFSQHFFITIMVHRDVCLLKCFDEGLSQPVYLYI